MYGPSRVHSIARMPDLRVWLIRDDEVVWRLWRTPRLFWTRHAALSNLQGKSLGELMGAFTPLHFRRTPPWDPAPGLLDLTMAEPLEIPGAWDRRRFDVYALGQQQLAI